MINPITGPGEFFFFFLIPKDSTVQNSLAHVNEWWNAKPCSKVTKLYNNNNKNAIKSSKQKQNQYVV